MNLREHLIERHVNFDVHSPILSEEVATFLLYNLSGKIVGYQRYNPTYPSTSSNEYVRQPLQRDRRYYNYTTDGSIGIFGLETFNLDVPVVFVTEGVFDATRLTKYGCCAFAMLCNNPSSSMRNFLDCLGKPVVSICDNDKAGNKLKLKGHRYEIVPFKDLGDASEEYVKQLINKYHVLK